MRTVRTYSRPHIALRTSGTGAARHGSSIQQRPRGQTASAILAHRAPTPFSPDNRGLTKISLRSQIARICPGINALRRFGLAMTGRAWISTNPHGLCLAGPAWCGEVRGSPVVAPDETGWKIGRVLHGLWAAATPTITVYRIAAGRGFDDAAAIIRGVRCPARSSRPCNGTLRCATASPPGTCRRTASPLRGAVSCRRSSTC